MSEIISRFAATVTVDQAIGETAANRASDQPCAEAAEARRGETVNAACNDLLEPASITVEQSLGPPDHHRGLARQTEAPPEHRT